ncbi:hypothetical protein OCU04_013034 [Sclerotinia nivalis]|uniref:Uncharacterized protein n=1 Tax=Sclerotinia nivalis TaxID=352851 RepID=A0A9X0A905_9HELO|nr:hypothetical protein OCU04_013034 [Sclerotinia nivalis]
MNLCMKKNGNSHINMLPAVKRLIAKADCFKFFKAEMILTSTDLQQISFYRHKAKKTLFKTPLPIVKQRLEQRGTASEWKETKKKPLEGMQWLIDTSRRASPWTVERIFGEIMTVWFGSATTFGIEDLGFFPKHVEPLKQEANKHPTKNLALHSNRRSLLESSLKEPARYTRVDARRSLVL